MSDEQTQPEQSVSWSDMTDDEFREVVLTPVLAEAERRRFTVILDPFGILDQNMGDGGATSPWESLGMVLILPAGIPER